MTSLFISDGIFSMEDLRQVALTKLLLDWNGQLSDYPISIGLASDRSSFHLIASANAAPVLLPDSPTGFVEGLWEADVVELFVSLPGTAYVEFNLSPNGAWWSTHFSDYRKRDESKTSIHCTTDTVVGPKEWNAILSIPRDALPVNTRLDQSPALNVTAISNTDTKRHFSLHTPHEAATPDFHLAALRIPIEIENFA